MGGGLIAAAGVVEVGDLVWIEDAEDVSAFGGQVDVSIGFEWSGGYEEHLLMFDELPVCWLDSVEELCHGEVF